MTFQLDTSGFVGDDASRPNFRILYWSDLDAFTQGYVEALFADLNGRQIRATSEGLDPYTFSDLAPETLARIIADCEAMAALGAGYVRDYDGANFWRRRQAGEEGHHFPPLTVQLSDDGKVRFA